MYKNLAELDASIQQKLDSDVEFQSSLENLTDDEKVQKVGERKQQKIDEELSALSEKAAKDAELAQNYKVRAEKAEAEAKKGGGSAPKTESDVSLTPKDTIALINAKVETDDFETVVEWAKFKKISVPDALKDKTLEVVLREKKEERITASAANLRGGRTVVKETPEEIVARASRGELSEDDEEIDKLVKARHQLKMKGVQK